MFDTAFSFTYLGKFPSTDNIALHLHKFRFKTYQNNTYIVDVEVYQDHIYALKFYLKNHRLSPHKFSFRTHEYIAHKVLGTCLNIAHFLYLSDEKASFTYVGINDISENKNNTKRYRIYKKISERFFDPANFEHFKNDNNSLYLILNKSNENINKDRIVEKLAQYYDVIF